MAKGQRVETDTVDTADLLPGPASPEFRYLHNVESWEHVTLEGESGDRTLLIPRLREFYFVPGANGVKLVGKKADPRAALVQLSLAGEKAIPINAPVFTTEGGKLVKSKGYLHTFKHQNGATSYAPVWATPTVAGRTVDWATLWDGDGYLATILHWVEIGLTHKPTPAIVANYTRVMRDRLSRTQGRAVHQNPEVQAQYAAKVDEYERLIAFRDQLTATVRKGTRVVED